MFSNESTFRMLRVVQRKVRRPLGSYRYSSRYTIKTMKHPDSVMVWACFTGDVGRGGLLRQVNGEKVEMRLLYFALNITRISSATGWRIFWVLGAALARPPHVYKR